MAEQQGRSSASLYFGKIPIRISPPLHLVGWEIAFFTMRFMPVVGCRAKKLATTANNQHVSTNKPPTSTKLPSTNQHLPSTAVHVAVNKPPGASLLPSTGVHATVNKPRVASLLPSTAVHVAVDKPPGASQLPSTGVHATVNTKYLIVNSSWASYPQLASCRQQPGLSH
jgi:hypothetical protein